MHKCEHCGQKLEEAADPRLKSLKDTAERAATQMREAADIVSAAKREHRESVAYYDKCRDALRRYEQQSEREKNAVMAAEFLEREAKKLREHPEIFDKAEWRQEKPVGYVDQHFPCYVDHTPTLTRFEMKTWPQRKVAKEGEEK